MRIVQRPRAVDVRHVHRVQVLAVLRDRQPVIRPTNQLVHVNLPASYSCEMRHLD